MILLSVVFVLSFGLTRESRASDFSVINSSPITWNVSGLKNVYVRKLHSGPLSISVSLTGSSTFSKSITGISFSDTTHDSIRYFSVRFTATSGDTSTALLILHDSSTTDTVRLVGYDTTYHSSPTADYRVSHDWPIVTVRRGYPGLYTGSLVYNLQYSPISLSAMIVGDTGWRFDSVGSQSMTFNLDSTHDRTSGKILVVYFHSTGKYLDTAKLILSCSSPLSQHDTIRLIARDSNYMPTSDRDFYVTHTWPTIITQPAISEPVYNTQYHPETVSCTLIGSSGWRFDSTGAQTRSLLLDSTHDRTSGHSLPIYYHHSGLGHDTAKLVLYCASPFVQRDTVTLYAADSSTHHDSSGTSPYHLHFSALSFNDVEPGDTSCGTVILSNPNAVPITVTRYYHTSNVAGWQWDSARATPFVLAPYDSQAIGLCYHTSECGTKTSFSINAYFEDSLHRTGAQLGTFYETGKRCIESSADTIRLTAIVGGYAEASVLYTNRDPHRDTLREAHYLDSTHAWSLVSNPLPGYVAFDSSVTTTFRFTPPSNTYYFGYYNVYTVTGNGHATILQARGISESDTSLNLYSAETELIALRSQTHSVTKTYYFHNNSARSIRITGVSLAVGTHFAITNVSPHSAPDTLAAGGVLAVDLQFDADTNGYYHDSLMVTIDQSLQSLAIDLQAVREGTAAVHTLPAVSGVSLSITPNPSTGPVSIALEGAMSASIEVYDLLGQRMAQFDHATQSIWNSSNLPQGTYLLRANGLDLHGKPFTLSQRIVVQR